MMLKYNISELLRKSFIYFYSTPLGLTRNEKNNIWRKKYRKKLIRYLPGSSIIVKRSQSDLVQSKIIFTSWLQGYDYAPDIVKRCIDSMNNQSEYKVINITEKNLSDYLDMPSVILKKWHNGIISNAHFSDLIRICLLYKYGGIWLDATVMLFDEIPEYISDAELFFYQHSFLDNSDIGISNWLISAKYKNNVFLGGLKEALVNYWKDNNVLNDYYLFHDFVSLLSVRHAYENMWEKVPYYSNVTPHILQHELYEKYSEKRFKEIIQMSPVQKLTYKLDSSSVIDTNLNFLLEKGESVGG